MNDVDLTINIKEFEAEKSIAKKAANETFHAEDPDQYYHWEGLDFSDVEQKIEENKLKISGSIINVATKKEIGFLSIYVKLDLDNLIEIFQSYIKKLNRVKTIMEVVNE